MQHLVDAVKEIGKHGEQSGFKSVKLKDGDKKLKIKFDKGGKKRAKAMEKAKKTHSIPH